MVEGKWCMMYGEYSTYSGAYKATSKWQWPPMATLLASVDYQTALIVGLCLWFCRLEKMGRV